MGNPDNTEDIDAMIDRAVDEIFVEAPDEVEMDGEVDTVEVVDDTWEESTPDAAQESPPQVSPSLQDAMDTLFQSSFQETETPPEEPAATEARQVVSAISSGDPEMDMAIDAAVDTLFVEEPESPPPDTAEIKVEEIISEPMEAGPTDSPVQPAPQEQQPSNETVDLVFPEDEPSEAPSEKPVAEERGDASFDDLLAQEIERHMHSLFTQTPDGAVSEEATQPQAETPLVAGGARTAVTAVESAPLRPLQEAILSLEWEISDRSIAALRKEIKVIREQYRDNVTVDFGALTMRVVLDYVVKRMSHAHPESIRFLLAVTGYLDKGLASSQKDPLHAFHGILSRYESYKSTVRLAEGLPDNPPRYLDDLEIRDTKRFPQVVEAHAMALIKAGYSLAKRVEAGGDAKNLIRSFRFLVNRSVSQILDKTKNERGKASKRKKAKRRH